MLDPPNAIADHCPPPFRLRFSTVLFHRNARRRLRSELRATFKLLSEDQLAAAWPSTARLEVQRLDAADRLTVYFVDDTPLLFSTSSRSDGKGARLWPTLYLLHIAPQIIPTIRVHHGVGRKLIGGADLFMPGVIVTEQQQGIGKSWVAANFGKFRMGDMVAIVECGDGAPWYPMALATWSLSSDDLEYRGLKGRGFDVQHTLHDFLWQQGHGNIPSELPASAAEALQSHTADIERAAADAMSAAAAQQRAAAEAQRLAFMEEGPRTIKRLEKALRQVQLLQDKVDRCGLVPNADQRTKLDRSGDMAREIEDVRARLALAMLPPEEAAEDPGNATPELTGGEGTTDTAAAGHPDVVTAARMAVEATADMGPKEQRGGQQDAVEEEAVGPSMDEVLMWSFLLALRESIKNSDLPLLVSTMYAQHVLPASRRLRNGVDLQMKQTSWRKIGPFLADMQTAGIIKVIDVKTGVQHLTAIDRTHTEYLSFDSDAHTCEEQDPAGLATAALQGAGGGAKAQRQWEVPASGTKKIQIATRKRGNKHVTVVRYLARFGLPLDDQLRKDISKKFSGSATYIDDPEKTAGPQLIVQGQYASELGQFLAERFGLPGQHILTEASKGKGKGKGR